MNDKTVVKESTFEKVYNGQAIRYLEKENGCPISVCSTKWAKEFSKNVPIDE